jgi:hypothetical protein
VVTVDGTDASSFVAIFDAATGNQAAKTDAGLTYDATTGTLTATVLSTPSVVTTGSTAMITLPTQATPTTDAAGELANDDDGWGTGFDALEFFNGTASAYLVATTASDTPSNGQVPTWNTGGAITWESAGSGTVTSVSVTTANGVSGSVATATTTPAITLTLGAITPTTVNGHTFTTGSSTFTGTAGQTYTFPTTTATLARTDAANTFTGTQAIGNGTTSSGVLQIDEDDDNGANYTRFQVGAQAADITYTLPTDDGTSGEVLSTDGAGVLDWIAAGSGSGGPIHLFRDVTLGTIDNTVTETAMFSFTVPGGTLGTTNSIVVKAGGDVLNASGAGATYILRVKYGGVTIYQDSTASYSSSVTARPWYLEFHLVAQDSTSAQICYGNGAPWNAASATTGIGDLATASHVNFQSAASTVDSTTDQTFTVTIEQSVANADVEHRTRYVHAFKE